MDFEPKPDHVLLPMVDIIGAGRNSIVIEDDDRTVSLAVSRILNFDVDEFVPGAEVDIWITSACAKEKGLY